MQISSQEMTDVDWASYAGSEESIELAAAAREHFGLLFSLADVREIAAVDSPPSLWPALVEQGYIAIGLPESLNGLGSFVDLAAVLEEAGRALLPAPLLATAAALQTLLSVGALDAEPSHSPRTIARRTGRGTLLAFDARGADSFVTVDSTGEGGAVVRLLERTDDACTALEAVDPSRTNLMIPDASTTVVHSVETAESADAVLSAARTCVAADLLGTASRALDAGVAHALSREQFGRPIGSFQAVKHLLADAYVAVERARSLTVGAAVAVDGDPLAASTARLAMLAKAAAAEAAISATALQTQLLGAMGLTYESDSPPAVRRVRHTVPFLGTPSDLYARVAAASVHEGAVR